MVTTADFKNGEYEICEQATKDVYRAGDRAHWQNVEYTFEGEKITRTAWVGGACW